MAAERTHKRVNESQTSCKKKFESAHDEAVRGVLVCGGASWDCETGYASELLKGRL